MAHLPLRWGLLLHRSSAHDDPLLLLNQGACHGLLLLLLHVLHHLYLLYLLLLRLQLLLLHLMLELLLLLLNHLLLLLDHQLLLLKLELVLLHEILVLVHLRATWKGTTTIKQFTTLPGKKEQKLLGFLLKRRTEEY